MIETLRNVLLSGGFDNLLHEIEDKVGILIGSAQIICALLAFLFIGSKLWKSWAQGEAIDFYAMLRPFVIGLCIMFFSSLPVALDILTSPISAGTEIIRESQNNSLNTKRVELEKIEKEIRDREARKKQQELEESEGGTIDAILNSITNGWNTAISGMKQFCLDAVYFLLQIINMLIIYFFRIYVVVAKIILILIGPFAFALALIPGYESNIKMWFARYINICLYIPICNIIGFVQCTIIEIIYYDPQIAAYAADNAANIIETQYIAGIFMMGISIFMYSCVPSFAAWIIDPSIFGHNLCSKTLKVHKRLILYPMFWMVNGI